MVEFSEESRSIGGVGYPAIHIRENDTGPDDCNHGQFGAFILAGPNSPLTGEIHGAHLLDVGPTLLELGGHEIPCSLQGRSLVTGSVFQPAQKGLYYPGTEEAHTNPTRQRGECLRALAGASG